MHTADLAPLLDLTELPGTVTVRSIEDIPTNRVAILVEHDASPFRPPHAGWCSFPKPMLADSGMLPAVATVCNATIDHHLRPWRRTDPNPFPTMRLFRWWPRARPLSVTQGGLPISGG